ncbi:MAG: glycosyl transferase family 2 [Frankiales bacterium]|nr:glycosyl transferase family 2 [Frankiales bacterium]
MIVTYESADVVGPTLRALPKDLLAAVVAVDNSPTPRTLEVLQADSQVHVVVPGENLGYGRGANLGADHEALGDAEFLLFLNPDAVIGSEDLERLVDWMDRHPDCALAGPRLFRGPEPLSSAGVLATPRQLLRLALPGPLLRFTPAWRLPASYQESGPVGYVEGACILVRAGAWRAAGRFDPRYFLFFEEMDVARRLERLGHTVDLVCAARAEHAVAASREQLPGGARRFLFVSAALYVDAWYGRAAARRWVAVTRFFLAVRALSRQDRGARLAARRALRGVLKREDPVGCAL